MNQIRIFLPCIALEASSVELPSYLKMQPSTLPKSAFG